MGDCLINLSFFINNDLHDLAVCTTYEVLEQKIP
jgi:hypothetical protein